MNGAAAACTFVIYVPSPIMYCALTLPLISTEPVILVPYCTSNPLPVADVIISKVSPLATDAVAEPLAIKKASCESADKGMLNNPSPLPLKKPLPDGIITLPLISMEPVNSEPLSKDSTLNP